MGALPSDLQDVAGAWRHDNDPLDCLLSGGILNLLGTCLLVIKIWYDMIWCDIFGDYNWVDTRWQQYSTHLHTNSTQYTFTHKQYTVHIYTQTVHRRTQLIWEECGPCPVFASYTLAFALQLRKKHGKTSVRVAEECQLARWKQNIQNRTYVTMKWNVDHLFITITIKWYDMIWYDMIWYIC